MVGPEPPSSLLDVVNHCLGISMDCVLGYWQAHIRVDSIFRGIRKQGNSIPVETWTVIDQVGVKIGSLILKQKGIQIWNYLFENGRYEGVQ